MCLSASQPLALDIRLLSASLNEFKRHERSSPTEEAAMHSTGRVIWYGVVAASVILLVIGYATGWFGAPQPLVPQQ